MGDVIGSSTTAMARRRAPLVFRRVVDRSTRRSCAIVLAGFPLRRAHVGQDPRAQLCHRPLAGSGHRRKQRHLQRRGRTPAAAATLPPFGKPGRNMAALSGHRHLSRLAVAGPVCRPRETEPLVRRDIHLAASRHDALRPGSARACGRNPNLVLTSAHARGKAATRAPAPSRRGQTRQGAGRYSQ